MAEAAAPPPAPEPAKTYPKPPNRRVKTPTLLVTGDADLYAPPAVLQMFAARIRNAESAIVPEVGHSTYWEQPEIFNTKVLEFISKHP